MKIFKFLDFISETVYMFGYVALALPMFFSMLSAVAAPEWSWGAFWFFLVLLFYLLHAKKIKLGVHDYVTRAIVIYSLSLYMSGLISMGLIYMTETVNYLGVLVAAIPVIFAAIYVNKVVDAVEATIENIELLKALRIGTVIPLFYILLATKTWSLDSGLYGMLPYILFSLYFIIKNSGKLKVFNKKENKIEVNKKATMQRPTSTLIALIIGAVVCVAIHILLATFSIGFDSMKLFDSSLFKVALLFCVLGFLIIKYYPKMECKVLNIKDENNTYVSKGGIYIILSMLSGIISALIGFEEPRSGAAMLCFVPILALYDAYLYTYNTSRRVYYMIFVFIINLIAGFIGISAAWMILFLLIVLFFFRLGTSMVVETISNPFGSGTVVPDSSRILVWDPELGRTVELHNTGAGLFDPSGNPWERGLAGGFKPQGSDRTPLSGQEM